MSNLLTKYQFIAFFGITWQRIIFSPTEKLIDNLLRKVYSILIRTLTSRVVSSAYLTMLVRSLSPMAKSNKLKDEAHLDYYGFFLCSRYINYG